MKSVCLALLTLAAGAALAAPSNCRLYLAEQYSWGDKTGFYLDLEGSELASLPLILGLADGQQWRFVSHKPPFQPDRDYRIRAVLGPERSEVFLDGQSVITMESKWQPFAGPLLVKNQPSWATDPGDWLAVVSRAQVAVTRDGVETTKHDFDFSAWAAASVALQLFERGGRPAGTPLEVKPGDTVTLDLTLRFGRADLRAYAPFIDRFGQARAADFPGKVKDEAELPADIADEDARLAKLPPLTGFDAYGGLKDAPWHEPPTGFFRVVRRDGKWWLVTPDGNPCFYTGVCAVPQLTWETTPITGREYLYEWLPPHDGPLAAAWSRNQWGLQDGTEYCCFYTANLVRKYGEGWADQATARGLKRLQAAGLQGGKWGCGVPLASTPVLHRWGTPSLAGHPDIFDPAVCARLRDELSKQITPRLQDPRVVGWSFGNEYDELIKRDEVRKIIGLPPATPARKALFDHALLQLYGGDLLKLSQAWKVTAHDPEALQRTQPQVPDADLEKLRLFYESRYHEFVYKTVKEIDPNHLYLGFWIVPGWWESPEDWAATTPHCDVIGYDRYSPQFADERLLGLLQQSDKPALCGEFSFPAFYDGQRGFGRYGTYATDEADSGKLYESWMRDATANPYCVGLIWFLYRDQPLTGRGAGHGDKLVIGEHFAFGLVTEQDRVKWPLVTAMREANAQAARWRLGGKP